VLVTYKDFVDPKPRRVVGVPAHNLAEMIYIWLTPHRLHAIPKALVINITSFPND
jgi:hypothetical protein